jgi:hypothetical protein
MDVDTHQRPVDFLNTYHCDVWRCILTNLTRLKDIGAWRLVSRRACYYATQYIKIIVLLKMHAKFGVTYAYRISNMFPFLTSINCFFTVFSPCDIRVLRSNLPKLVNMNIEIGFDPLDSSLYWKEFIDSGVNGNFVCRAPCLVFSVRGDLIKFSQCPSKVTSIRKRVAIVSYFVKTRNVDTVFMENFTTTFDDIKHGISFIVTHEIKKIVFYGHCPPSVMFELKKIDHVKSVIIGTNAVQHFERYKEHAPFPFSFYCAVTPQDVYKIIEMFPNTKKIRLVVTQKDAEAQVKQAIKFLVQQKISIVPVGKFVEIAKYFTKKF